jgi:hypothetical protein
VVLLLAVGCAAPEESSATRSHTCEETLAQVQA